MALEFGLDTFLPITVDESGLPVGGDQAIRNAVEEAVLAEAVGVDSFNIGEHYRTEFMDSAGLWSSPRSQAGRRQSGSAPPSRFSARKTRCGCTPTSPRSTPSRTAARS